jgi:hypothetical protein
MPAASPWPSGSASAGRSHWATAGCGRVLALGLRPVVFDLGAAPGGAVAVRVHGEDRLGGPDEGGRDRDPATARFAERLDPLRLDEDRLARIGRGAGALVLPSLRAGGCAEALPLAGVQPVDVVSGVTGRIQDLERARDRAGIGRWQWNGGPVFAGFATNWTSVPLLLALRVNDVPGISVSKAWAGVVSDTARSPAASVCHARALSLEPRRAVTVIGRMSFSFGVGGGRRAGGRVTRTGR